MLINKKASYNFGLLAEDLAVIYLRFKLYKILARRYKSKLGEVDIIARRGKNLVFIEVKARKNASGIYEVLSTHQRARITRAASLFLAKNQRFNNSNIRFDVILIAPKMFRHIRNAW
jgi:putative endonuclease